MVVCALLVESYGYFIYSVLTVYLRRVVLIDRRNVSL